MARLERQLMGKPGRTSKPIQYNIPSTPTALRALCDHLACDRDQCKISGQRCKGNIEPHTDQIAAAQLEKLGFAKTTGYCKARAKSVNIILMNKVKQLEKT